MTSANSAFLERSKRIQQAISLQKPDRVPVVLEFAGFAAQVTGTTMANYISSPSRATQVMIQAFELVGGGDAINYGSFSPYHLCTLFGAKVRLPGYELPEHELWQVVETEIMTRRDYKRILEIGWPTFFEGFCAERLFEDALPGLLPANQKSVDVKGLWEDRGIPVLTGGDITTPFELLCGARSLENFFQDLVEIPDTVERVMEAILTGLAGPACSNARRKGFPVVWIGGWRTAPDMLSPQMWDRFVWPYFRYLVQEVIDSGLTPLLHLDSCWERELHRFLEFPDGKLLVALDGETDIYKAKDIFNGRQCIMGDVPASLLAFGQPREVYDYSKELVEDIGPRGFILQSGCDIPANAKLENVQAMVAAAINK